MVETVNKLLTEQQLWDDIWSTVEEPWLFLPDRIWVHHVWAELFRTLLPPAPATCLEIGCGGSPYLPWFAGELGLTVAGLDYSARGLELCENGLRKLGVTGRLIQGDSFAMTKTAG